MNPDFDILPADDALDNAIREALRLKADQSQLARLEQSWRVRSQRDRWQRNALRAFAALAAAIALVAVSFLWKPEKGLDLEQVVQAPPQTRDHSLPVIPDVVEKTGPREQLPAAGREPTPFERLVFVARTNVEAPTKRMPAAMDQVIRQLAEDAALDATNLLASAGLTHRDAEALLLRRLPKAPTSEQAAILRLLTVCGSARSTPALLRLARNENFRDEALAALEHIVGIEHLAQAVASTSDPDVRAALMLRLLAADSPAALRGYVSLVQNAATRSEALSAARTSMKFRAAEFFTLLDDSEEPVRVAAAIVLGYVNGPEITRQLIARVIEQPADSTAAWLALMTCRGELAQEFLNYASQRPQLLGYYNNARVRYPQFTPYLVKEQPPCPHCAG